MRLPDIQYNPRMPTPRYPEQDDSLEKQARLVGAAVEGIKEIKQQQDKLKVQQATAALKGANASISQMLVGADAIDIDSGEFGKSASESLRVGAGAVNDTDVYEAGGKRFVPTEKVIDTVYATSLRDQFDMITDGYSEELKAQVWANFSESQTATMRDLAQHKRDLTKGKVSAGYSQLFDSYVMQGDIQGAMKAAEDAVGTGAWSPKEYTEAKERGMRDYYAASALSDIANANSDDELDEIERRIKGNIDLFGAQQSRQFLNDVDERRNDMKRFIEDNRKATGNYLVLQYSQGKLTQDELDDAAMNGAIEPTAYLSWTERLKTDTEKSQNKPLIRSDKGTLDSLQFELQSIKYANGTETTVTQRAREYQARVMRLAGSVSATNPNAPSTPRAISIEDAQKLVEESEKITKSVLRPENFDAAKSIVGSYTGMDVFGQTTDVASKTAYQAFYGEMIDYIETAGAEADLMVWVEKNKHRFNPKIATKKTEDRFLQIYPQYSNNVTEIRETDAEGRTVVTKKLDTQAVKSQLFQDHRNGSITKTERDTRYYDLIGEQGTKTDIERLRLQEDQELFYRTLQEFGGQAQ